LSDHDDIFFLLVGDGSEAPRLILEIEELGLSNIRILPAMPQPDYLQCLSEFDVGVVSLNRHLQSNNFTGKLLGYVSCGKPVLASVNPGNDLVEFLHRADAGIACANGDDDALLQATLLLATQPQIRQRMGENAHALTGATFSVESVARQIVSHFQSAKNDDGIAVGQSVYGANPGGG
jgi:glycosyltransferase involved in cell wall biosynthesis